MVVLLLSSALFNITNKLITDTVTENSCRGTEQAKKKKRQKNKNVLRSQSWLENSAVFNSWPDSCSEEAAQTGDDRPFQARAAAIEKTRSSSVMCLVDQCQRYSRPETMTCTFVDGLPRSPP